MIYKRKQKMKLITFFTVSIFLASFLLSIVGTISMVVFAFKNPSMTLTQVIMYVFHCTKWWVPIVTLILSYIGIVIIDEVKEK